MVKASPCDHRVKVTDSQNLKKIDFALLLKQFLTYISKPDNDRKVSLTR